MENSKLKITIFILLVLVLFTMLFYAIFGFSLSYLNESDIKENRELNDNLISFLKINNIDAVYDKENNIYYYTIPEEYEGNKYTLKLELDDKFKYKILDYTTNIITVDYNKKYDIIIYDDKNYYESSIILTNLPLIDINTDAEISDNDTNSIFKYINPYNIDKVVTYNSKIHIRGATSKRYDKKSYKLEIYDSDFEKNKNINISNFYFGSSFILDAMFRDNSKVRNVIASEIWDVVSDDFTTVDIYSEYVELFINGKYAGLYNFTEPINRKNLNLNKSGVSDTSVIIKSNESRVPEANGLFSNIIEDKYLDFELKYPNDENLYSVAWEQALTKLALYYEEDYEKTEKNIAEVFDLNNYIDLLIFNSFIDNSDNNLIKNNYFYMRSLSSKINIQPWDMEFSFGLEYSEEEKYNYLKDTESYLDVEFNVSRDDLIKLKKYIVNRYWNLRNTIISEQYLNKLLDEYKNKLSKGASLRDSKIWVNYDVEKEIDDIKTWINKRINVYDNYIRGLSNE